jgi:hypothetical protein
MLEEVLTHSLSGDLKVSTLLLDCHPLSSNQLVEPVSAFKLLHKEDSTKKHEHDLRMNRSE